MDKETLANHISRLGKRDFEIACRLILHDIFNLIAVNVDGANDGGTDFAVFNSEGNRTKAAYQITTQKTDIRIKRIKMHQNVYLNYTLIVFIFYPRIHFRKLMPE